MKITEENELFTEVASYVHVQVCLVVKTCIEHDHAKLGYIQHRRNKSTLPCLCNNAME